MRVFGAGMQIEDRRVQVPHSGTFNGNPLSAAAGISLLSHIKDGTAQADAESSANRLVKCVNDLAIKHRVDVHLYHQSSIFHILIGADQAGVSYEPSAAVVQLFSKHPEHYATLRRALLREGLDTHPVHGWLSTAHDTAVIERSAEAFDRAFRELRNASGFTC
jgi:glutamate-1-semialdehyde 2,1-aminomutase